MSTEGGPHVPLILAQALTGMSRQGLPTIVVGNVPAGWPWELVPPAPATLLGGLTFDSGPTSVFLYPPDFENAVGACRAMFERHSWQPLEGMFDSGFQSTRMTMLTRGRAAAHLHRLDFGPQGQCVVISLTPWNDMERGFPHQETLDVPMLAPPIGVRADSGGGGGGSDRWKHAHIQLTTDLSPGHLLPLYAKQLTDKGWTSGEAAVTDSSAVQWLETRDGNGDIWRGMLVITVNGVGRDVAVQMSKDPSGPDRFGMKWRGVT